jgi:hypothetical protein
VDPGDVAIAEGCRSRMKWSLRGPAGEWPPARE